MAGMDPSNSEFIVLNEKSQSNSGVKSSKSNQSLITEKSKMSDYAKKAIKAVTEYNYNLNQTRREQRRISMDLQTYTFNYPVGLGIENKLLKKNIADGKVYKAGKYPVAVVHGQYQDWYIPYSSQELKYFPINTVIYGPVVNDPSKIPPLTDDGSSLESESESDHSDYCDGFSCSSNEENHKSKKAKDDTFSSSSSSSSQSSSDSEESRDSVKLDTICRVCKETDSEKQNAKDELVYCSECESCAHASCLDLTSDMVEVIRSYKWQCMQCKTCVHCNKPHEEDRMIICDKCDRGYHTFCVGLKNLPTGKWVCSLCAQCGQCGDKNPGDGGKASWQHETIKIISPSGETLRRHQLLCMNCYKQRKR